MATAEILIVGDEILHGEVKDQNGPWLIQRLSDRGIEVNRMTVIPDEPENIAGEIQRIRNEEEPADYVLVTGGIGPTHDDRTREGISLGLNREQEINKQVLDWLNQYYGEDINDARRRMANLPVDSEAILLKNTPAIAFRTDNLFVFPGIPELMKPLFEKWEDQFTPVDLASRSLNIRAREGDIADVLNELQEEFTECSLGCYPHPDGTLTLKIRGRNEKRVQEAHGRLKDTFEQHILET